MSDFQALLIFDAALAAAALYLIRRGQLVLSRPPRKPKEPTP